MFQLQLHAMAWLTDDAKYVWTQNILCDLYVDCSQTLSVDVN